MKRLTLLVACWTATFPPTLPAQTTPRDQRTVPTITVNGLGIATMEPNLATVQLGIESQAKRSVDAQKDASETARRIIEAVMAKGLSRKGIQTGALTLEAVYSDTRRDETMPYPIAAYRARNSLTLRVTNLTRLSIFIDAAINAGANQIDDITFGVWNDLPARKAALKDAVLEARAKAEAIALAQGGRLGELLEINETGGYNSDRVSRLEKRVDSSTPVLPGQLTLRVGITAKYRFTKK